MSFKGLYVFMIKLCTPLFYLKKKKTFLIHFLYCLSRYSVIPTLADILSESVKEKVTRITLAVFRNLIEKPEDPAIARENSIQMVQCKVRLLLFIFYFCCFVCISFLSLLLFILIVC